MTNSHHQTSDKGKNNSIAKEETKEQWEQYCYSELGETNAIAGMQRYSREINGCNGREDAGNSVSAVYEHRGALWLL